MLNLFCSPGDWLVCIHAIDAFVLARVVDVPLPDGWEPRERVMVSEILPSHEAALFTGGMVNYAAISRKACINELIGIRE